MSCYSACTHICKAAPVVQASLIRPTKGCKAAIWQSRSAARLVNVEMVITLKRLQRKGNSIGSSLTPCSRR